MKLRTFLLSILLAAIAIALPDVIKVSTGIVEEVNVTSDQSRCIPVSLWNSQKLQFTVTVSVDRRPTDYAVLWTTQLPHTDGVAMTIDLYGNLFLSIRSLVWGSGGPKVFLISKPFEPGSQHEIVFWIEGRALDRAIVDGDAIEIRSVDGSTVNTDRSLDTTFSQICTGYETQKYFLGHVGLRVVGLGDERDLQIVFFKVLLLIVSLGVLLRGIHLRGTEESEE